jgi:hypothetical protein
MFSFVIALATISMVLGFPSPMESNHTQQDEELIYYTPPTCSACTTTVPTTKPILHEKVRTWSTWVRAYTSATEYENFCRESEPAGDICPPKVTETIQSYISYYISAFSRTSSRALVCSRVQTCMVV